MSKNESIVEALIDCLKSKNELMEDYLNLMEENYKLKLEIIELKANKTYIPISTNPYPVWNIPTITCLDNLTKEDRGYIITSSNEPGNQSVAIGVPTFKRYKGNEDGIGK